jgi:hypothetical protein
MRDTLEAARELVKHTLRTPRSRVNCPCCDRIVRLRCCQIYESLALTLAAAYEKYDIVDEFHFNDIYSASGDYAKLRYWGFIEEAGEKAGIWKVTKKGAEFLHGYTEASTLWTYNREVLFVDVNKSRSFYDCTGYNYGDDEDEPTRHRSKQTLM